MLGIVAEAEDVVQEAYLRWHQTNRDAVRDAEAVLVRTVTRLCLDVLKSARVRREEYVGTWLPEPIIETVEGDVTCSAWTSSRWRRPSTALPRRAASSPAGRGTMCRRPGPASP
ncbi:sigma factor [Stigmatella aurantiaca]|uniref:sigma factor n=1 Tax=Stigmatella aurantiaca TaxID=41 RepID=UPI003CCBFD52